MTKIGSITTDKDYNKYNFHKIKHAENDNTGLVAQRAKNIVDPGAPLALRRLAVLDSKGCMKGEGVGAGTKRAITALIICIAVGAFGIIKHLVLGACAALTGKEICGLNGKRHFAAAGISLFTVILSPKIAYDFAVNPLVVVARDWSVSPEKAEDSSAAEKAYLLSQGDDSSPAVDSREWKGD